MRKKKHKKPNKVHCTYIISRQKYRTDTRACSHTHTQMCKYMCAQLNTHRHRDINAPTHNVLFSFCANLSTPPSSVVNYCKLLKKKGAQTNKQKESKLYMAHHFRFIEFCLGFLLLFSLVSCLLSPLTTTHTPHKASLQLQLQLQPDANSSKSALNQNCAHCCCCGGCCCCCCGCCHLGKARMDLASQ